MEQYQSLQYAVIRLLQVINQCSSLQLPLKLAWAVTIHKSQGLTLDKVVIDVGKEFSCELTFVACSRVRKLKDILFMPPFPLQRLKSNANSKRLQERNEDQRLLSLQESTAKPFIEDIPLPVSISEDQETTLMEWMTPSLLTLAPFLQPIGSQEDMEWMTPLHQHHLHQYLLLHHHLINKRE
uniref:ATP-dependent DNA helicase n=1 Tax=Amphimedon queenslandica TaxID=400682 RepID=A0A1X7U1D6_AMPQE